MEGNMKKRNKLIVVCLLAVLLLVSSVIFVAASDNVDVVFYDGDDQYTVSVPEGNVPKTPAVTEVIVKDGVAYRIVGWTSTMGGTEAEELSVATEGVAYYAVREAVGFGIESENGEKKWYAPGTIFSEVMSAVADGDKVRVYADFEIDSLVYVASDVTVDLGGKTVSTTSYIVPDKSNVVIENGVVNITKRELAQLTEYRSATSTLTLRDLTVVKGADSANMYLLDVRMGSVLMDNVTVNDGEWQIPTSGAREFIAVGYKTRAVSAEVNFEILNSNIRLPKVHFINAGGASGETNGYSLNVNITGTTMITGGYALNYNPAPTAVDNCRLNMNIKGESVIGTNGGFTNQVLFNISTAVGDENAVIRADLGVAFSKLPRLAAGTLILGNGDAILEMRDEDGYGFVTELWAENYTPVTDYAYSFCVVGDTQMTNDYDPSNFGVLYDWIVKNYESKKIQYVFGMGDITNHSADDEWSIAKTHTSKLNGKVLYSLIRGNHDTTETYNATFNNDAYKSMFDGFLDETKIENSYVTFTVGDVKYLHITLDYQPSDEALLWANILAAKYYDHRVIVSTHDYLASDGSLDTRGSSSNGSTNSGEQIWNKLISRHENMFLVLSGHVFSTDLVCVQTEGKSGNVVTQLMTNGQTLDYRNGAVGLVSMLYFSEDGRTVSVEYYSTLFDKYLKNSNQFTVTVPEYAPVEPETPDYLYEVSDKNGNVTTYPATALLSDVLAATPSGGTVTVYGDINVDKGYRVTVNCNLNLNGYTMTTDGGKINVGNCTFNVMNGKIKMTSNEAFYVGEGYAQAKITVSDVEISSSSKAFADVRGGSFTLNNASVLSGNWASTITASFFSVGYKTNAVSRAINIIIKNSEIDLGTASTPLVGFTGASGQTNGWTGNVSIINSDISLSGYAVQAKPVSTSAENCGLNISFDGTSTVRTPNFFNVPDTIAREKINVSIEIGARLGSIPAIKNVEVSFGGTLALDSTAGLIAVVDEAGVLDSCGAKLVDSEGEIYLYVIGTAFTKDLVDTVSDSGYTLVLLKDMTVPAGTSDSLNNITAKTLTVDLNGKTLIMSAYAQFNTASNVATVISFKNGTIRHTYQVFYSYNGDTNVVSFTAENVKFIATANRTCFDHRIGTVTLIDCEYNFNVADPSAQSIFTLGSVNDKKSAKLYLDGCTFNTKGDYRSIFKLYNGRVMTIEAEGCTFNVGASAYIIDSTDYRKSGNANTLSFTDCVFNKREEGSNLFNLEYDNIDITLEEIYVSCGSSIESELGSVKLAEGQRIAQVKEGGYLITSPDVRVKANLTLYVDFTLNIWLPVGTTATTVVAGGKEYKVSEMPVIDGYYKITVRNIGAGSAADEIDILITYLDGDITPTFTINYSVIDYVKTVLGSEAYGADLKALLVNIADYVKSAYIYGGKAVPASLTELLASDAYRAAVATENCDRAEAIPESETDLGTANNALVGAMLSLDSAMRFTLYVKDGYTGTVTLTYGGKSYTYEVDSGLIDGKNYIEINLRAYALYSDVIYVTAGECEGSYDFTAYANGTMKEYAGNDKLADLLLDLYNYAKEAYEYKGYVDANGGVMN